MADILPFLLGLRYCIYSLVSYYATMKSTTMRALIIIVALFPTSIFGQDARAIVNHYLDTVSNGNIDNWNRIKSIYKESEAYYSQNDFEQRVNLFKPDKSSFIKSFRVLPYNFKHDIYSDSSFQILTSSFYYLKEKTVLLLDNTPPIIKQAPSRDEFYSAHLPVKISKLMSKSRSVELLGIKEFPLDELLCYEIKMTAKGRSYLLYINTETFLLEYWNDREDEDLSILTRFSNYRQVDEFLVPMSESLLRNGTTFFWEHTKRYLINSKIDIEMFNYKDN